MTCYSKLSLSNFKTIQTIETNYNHSRKEGIIMTNHTFLYQPTNVNIIILLYSKGLEL